MPQSQHDRGRGSCPRWVCGNWQECASTSHAAVTNYLTETTSGWKGLSGLRVSAWCSKEGVGEVVAAGECTRDGSQLGGPGNRKLDQRGLLRLKVLPPTSVSHASKPCQVLVTKCSSTKASGDVSHFNHNTAEQRI